MDPNTLNTILVAVQVLTLIALVIYVIKTWEMASATKQAAEVSRQTLEEMKESRDQEVAPYVVVHFELPFGKRWIYLVVKNIGKSIAEDIRVEFTPPLRNTEGEKISNLAMIQHGIPSLPPNAEVRTFFDTTLEYFKHAELPLAYDVKVSYAGGINATKRISDQVIDLSAHKGRIWVDEKGMHELVREVHDLVHVMNRVSQDLNDLSNKFPDPVQFNESREFDSDS